MTTMQDLVEFHDIKQLKHRYLRSLDTHDWDLMRSCFAEDATSWYSGGAFSHQGRDAIVDFLASLIPDEFIASHIVTQEELELTGPATAKGIWHLRDTVWFMKENPVFTPQDIHGGEEMRGAGFYYDEYVKIDGQWLIRSTGYERIFEMVEPRDGRTGLKIKTDPLFGRYRR